MTRVSTWKDQLVLHQSGIDHFYKTLRLLNLWWLKLLNLTAHEFTCVSRITEQEYSTVTPVSIATGGTRQNSRTFHWLYNDFTEIFKTIKTELLNVSHDCPHAMSQTVEIHACINKTHIWNSSGTPNSVSHRWYINHVLGPPIGIALCARTKYLSKNLNIPWAIANFHDFFQNSEFPWHFSKFPNFSMTLNFPDFSLTSGNPAGGRTL